MPTIVVLRVAAGSELEARLTRVMPEKLFADASLVLFGTISTYFEGAGPDGTRRAGLLAYTAPVRTFLDLLAASTPMEPLRDAYRDAVDRALVRRSALQRDGATVRAYVDGSASVGPAVLIDRLARLLEGA